MRSTLIALAVHPRMTGAALASVLWRGKDPEPRKPIAEGRLRAAVKANYAHVAFEPPVGTAGAIQYRRPVYAISAAGRTAIGLLGSCR